MTLISINVIISIITIVISSSSVSIGGIAIISSIIAIIIVSIACEKAEHINEPAGTNREEEHQHGTWPKRDVEHEVKPTE